MPQESSFETSSFPEIATLRLALREIRQEDAPRLHEIWTDPEVLRYLVLDPFTTLDQTLEMISILKNLRPLGGGFRWALTLVPEERIIGTCGFHNWKKEHSRAELGYELEPLSWGRGLMSEAIRAALDFGFERMGLNRIEAFVTTGNVRSLGLLERNGFSMEGTLRQYEWARGSFQDQWVFSLLRQDWENRRIV
jgi:ribosomal-protein-alanine N-acetyltransferase